MGSITSNAFSGGDDSEELKKEVAGYSVSIAEKLVRHELKETDAQKALIDQQLKQMTAGNSANA